MKKMKQVKKWAERWAYNAGVTLFHESSITNDGFGMIHFDDGTSKHTKCLTAFDVAEVIGENPHCAFFSPIDEVLWVKDDKRHQMKFV